MSSIDDRRDPNAAPVGPVPDYRPLERFWPYVDLPEEPTAEELASLSPELSAALFGTARQPFSITVEFPAFEGADFQRALEMARASREFRELQTREGTRYRARFRSEDAVRLRELFHLVDRYDGTEVLIDDRPVPYARELWLPLVWCLIR